MDQALNDRPTVRVDDSEYSDQEEAIDVLLALVPLLTNLLHRRLPKALEQEVRSALRRIDDQLTIKEEWLQ